MIRVIGIDLAFANVGLSLVGVDQAPDGSFKLDLLALRLITTSSDKDTRKVVRKSSEELRRAREIHAGIQGWINETGATLAFAEIPSGTQSASAARGLGIAVGVMACIQLPVLEVTPMEVKKAVATGKAPSKAEIIAWATTRWPNANWLRHNGRITQNNEHLADAAAVVVAGVKTQPFQQLIALNPHALSSPTRRRRVLI